MALWLFITDPHSFLLTPPEGVIINNCSLIPPTCNRLSSSLSRKRYLFSLPSDLLLSKDGWFPNHAPRGLFIYLQSAIYLHSPISTLSPTLSLSLVVSSGVPLCINRMCQNTLYLCPTELRCRPTVNHMFLTFSLYS